MNKVDEQPNIVTIVVVLVSLVVGILTTGIQVVYESCWRSIFSAGRQRDSQLAILWESQYVMTRLGRQGRQPGAEHAYNIYNMVHSIYLLVYNK